jgi:hypothetical protein
MRSVAFRCAHMQRPAYTPPLRNRMLGADRPKICAHPYVGMLHRWPQRVPAPSPFRADEFGPPAASNC